MSEKINKFCQSCGMPLKKGANSGTEKDGSKSLDYCYKCYENGKFIGEDATLEAMREIVLNHMKKEMKIPRFIGKILTANMKNLKRWKK